MTTKTSDLPGANTQHGVLVAFGEFLQQHGLIKGLMQVPVPQKIRRFSPQTKLVEFLAGITPHLRLGTRFVKPEFADRRGGVAVSGELSDPVIDLVRK